MTRTARFAWGAVVVIIVGVIVLLIDALGGTPDTTRPAEPPQTSASVLVEVSHVPASVFDAAGSTADVPLTAPRVVKGNHLLRSRGKPEVLFVGAEFCPFCAAERWPLVVALSRFGRFTVLRDATSSPDTVFPSTASFSFADTTYQSPYLTFTGVELYSSTPAADGSYARMDRLTPAEATLVARGGGSVSGPRPSGSGGGTMPFVDVGGRVVATTSAFSPAVLTDQGQGAVAAALTQPHQPTTEAIVAAANQLSAGICAVTGQRPRAVCTSDGVAEARTALGLPG